MMAIAMRAAADDVHEAVVPDSGHWIIGGKIPRQATVAMVRAFCSNRRGSRQIRALNPRNGDLQVVVEVVHVEDQQPSR